MDTLLEAIDVCDVDGFCFGNHTNEEAGTGCTVIVAPEGATGGVDVRGGAPASRETDLLRPENTVDKVHAVCLSGGSAFGLEAASGVARELESRGIGLPVGPTQVPCAPAASSTSPLATPPYAPTLRLASPPCARRSTTPPPRSSRAM